MSTEAKTSLEVAPERSSPGQGRRALSDRAIVFIWPTLALLIAINIFPLFYSLYLSFTDYSAIANQAPVWVAFENFGRILGSEQMWGIFATTGQYVFFSVALQLFLIHDVARSLIHHGFNRLIFVNGHGSNVKVIDPVLRKLRYETGALVSFVKPYMENYVGILEGLMENPWDETPGWHSSELETSQDMAWNEELVRMERAEFTRAHIPQHLPETFDKKDGMPDVAFEGYKYFTFPMDHRQFIESGMIGNPLRATKEKGEEAFRRLSEHVARGVLELMKVEVDVHDREFVDRVL